MSTNQQTVENVEGLRTLLEALGSNSNSGSLEAKIKVLKKLREASENFDRGVWEEIFKLALQLIDSFWNLDPVQTIFTKFGVSPDKFSISSFKDTPSGNIIRALQQILKQLNQQKRKISGSLKNKEKKEFLELLEDLPDLLDSDLVSDLLEIYGDFCRRANGSKARRRGAEAEKKVQEKIQEMFPEMKLLTNVIGEGVDPETNKLKICELDIIVVTDGMIRTVIEVKSNPIDALCGLEQGEKLAKLVASENELCLFQGGTDLDIPFPFPDNWSVENDFKVVVTGKCGQLPVNSRMQMSILLWTFCGCPAQQKAAVDVWNKAVHQMTVELPKLVAEGRVIQLNDTL